MDVSGFGTPETIGVAVDALAVDWREAVELAGEMVLEPTFPPDRCDWIRRQARAELESLREQPEVLAGWAFMRQLYGEHPWGRPLIGSVESLREIDQGSCAEYHRAAGERGVIVSIAGDIDEDEVLEAVTERFRDHRPAARESRSLPRPSPVGGESSTDLPPADQAQVLIGRLTVAASDPDYVPLEVASVVLGSGPGLVGRIPERIREREGLAYAASALATAGAGSEPGRLVVQAGTAPRQVDRLVVAVREELDSLVTEGVRPGEVEEAKRYLLGSDPFRREAARQIAGLGAQAALLGLPVDDPGWLGDALGAIGPAEVEAAARRHLDPSDLTVTIGVPIRESSVEDPVEKGHDPI